MKAIKVLASAEVGKMIDKIVKGASTLSSDLHETMVQCALHVREHGNTELCARLVNELQDNDDPKLKGAAIINVQGIRKWFGDACPMVIDRAGKWKLMEKDSETYTKYVDRMMKASTPDKSEANPDPKAQPDETHGPGSRIFFVTFMSDRPFWTDGAVQAAQRQNIRVLGVSQLMGNVYAIQRTFKKAIDEGTFGGDAKLGEEFLQSIIDQTEAFKKKHAADLIGEPQKLEAFKEAKLKAETTEVASEVQSQTGSGEGAPEQQPDDEQQPAQVGGDVTANLGEPVEEDGQKTGTEG